MENHERSQWSPSAPNSPEELVADLRAATSEVCKQVEQFARREPLTALAIAGGVGLLVGVMLTKR